MRELFSYFQFKDHKKSHEKVKEILKDRIALNLQIMSMKKREERDLNL